MTCAAVRELASSLWAPLVALGLAACTLNPQPLPPDTPGLDSGTTTAGNGGDGGQHNGPGADSGMFEASDAAVPLIPVDSSAPAEDAGAADAASDASPPPAQDAAVDGPVEDSALVLQAIAGHDPSCARSRAASMARRSRSHRRCSSTWPDRSRSAAHPAAPRRSPPAPCTTRRGGTRTRQPRRTSPRGRTGAGSVASRAGSQPGSSEPRTRSQRRRSSRHRAVIRFGDNLF